MSYLLVADFEGLESSQEFGETDLTFLAEGARIVARHGDEAEREALLAFADAAEAALVAGGGEVRIALLTLGAMGRLLRFEHLEIRDKMRELGMLDEHGEPLDDG